MNLFDGLWLTASVRLATPILFAATGELVSQRAGILNIGLEGMILSGAFASFVVALITSSIWLGVVGGLAAGLFLGGLMAVLTVRGQADQIIVGVGLNILALGATTVGFRAVSSGTNVLEVPTMSIIRIPFLSEIPYIGQALFAQISLIYALYLIVPAVWFALYRTSWGLSLRAVGEKPEAADAAGVNVERMRWSGILIAGALAGLGGAFLSIGQLGLFVEGMSGGKGFLALAAVIFGAWRPIGVVAAALLFGAADALQLRLQAEKVLPREVWLALGTIVAGYIVYKIAVETHRRPRWVTVLRLTPQVIAVIVSLLLFSQAPAWTLPSQLWLGLPYALSILVLAGVVGRLRAPAALTVPYRRAG